MDPIAHPPILVLEDDQSLNDVMRDHFKVVLPDTPVLFAHTVAEAQVLISQYETILIYIIDVNLPDGNGLDFLGDVKTVHPAAKALIITAAPVPGLKQQAMDVGALQVLEKPLDMFTFRDLVRSIATGTTGSASDHFHFHGTLRQLQLVDIIQIKCIGKASAVLQFTNPEGEIGRIHFYQGEIVHAETANEQGVPAFNTIVCWKAGAFSELDAPVAQERTIFETWESLLMEAVRLADEQQPPPSEPEAD